MTLRFLLYRVKECLSDELTLNDIFDSDISELIYSLKVLCISSCMKSSLMLISMSK